jgi:MoaA/NifB/PqqE/SkfB family radical SAM enzyme
MKTIAVEHSSDKQSKIFKIEWNMSKRCNFQCSYCDEFTSDRKSPHLSFDIAKKAIDKILSKLEDKQIKVNLTGGEPTVNPEFEKILSYMYEKNIDVGLITNGSRTLEFYKRIMPKLKSFIMSYHMEYHNREVLPGNILELNKFIKENNYNIHLHVHMMMLPTMFAEAKNVVKMLKENDIACVIRRIRPAYMKNDSATYDKDGRLIDGEIALPHYKDTVTLKIGPNGSPDYSYDKYYSLEEKQYLENIGV